MKGLVNGLLARASISFAALFLATIGATAADPGIYNDRIVIGSYLPLQSGLAAGANQLRAGADAYFRHINDQGGIYGRKIEWIVENDSYNPQQTIAIARKLVDRDRVFAIVSTLGTATNLAALPFLVQRGVPLINPAGGHERLNAPTDRIVFGMLPVGQEIGKSMVRFALDELNAKRIAILFQNDQFGKDPRDGAVEELEGRGLKPVAEASYVPSDVDVSAQAVALRDANPDVVVMAVITKQGALFLREAQKLGWKPKFVAMNTMGDPITLDLASDSLEGVYVNIMTAVETMDNPKVREANAILAKYHPDVAPGYWSYLGFAGAIAFVEGARRAGQDLTREKLISALESLGSFEPGVVPPLQWSKDNHGGSTVFGFAQWRDGRLQVIRGW